MIDHHAADGADRTIGQRPTDVDLAPIPAMI